LLLPECLGQNDDLKLAERQRPSPEQVAAQKGAANALSTITSALRGMGFGPSDCVLLVNLTGHVEDVGVAAPAQYDQFLSVSVC
jgi:hypothetical protein